MELNWITDRLAALENELEAAALAATEQDELTLGDETRLGDALAVMADEVHELLYRWNEAQR